MLRPMKTALLASLALPLSLMASPAAAQEEQANNQPITLVETPATVESAIRLHTNYIERFDDAGPMLNAVIVYDARTLEEVKRLPMKKPSGKYNVWNKISFEAGTSH